MTSTPPDASSARKERPSLVDICVDVDLLAAALDRANIALASATMRSGAMSPLASSTAVAANWRDSLDELQAAFETTDQCGRTLIQSVRLMLALE